MESAENLRFVGPGAVDVELRKSVIKEIDPLLGGIVYEIKSRANDGFNTINIVKRIIAWFIHELPYTRRHRPEDALRAGTLKMENAIPVFNPGFRFSRRVVGGKSPRTTKL